MRYQFFYIITIILLGFGCHEKEEAYQVTSTLRAPAYPLISIDTYTNAWLFGDCLYDRDIVHWTGKPFPLLGALRVDGKIYRFMGQDKINTSPMKGVSISEGWEGSYSLEEPHPGWKDPGFNDGNWMKGPAAFGRVQHEQSIQTAWTTNDIWVRKTFTLEESLEKQTLFLEYSHDDDVEIYVNGTEVVNTGNSCNNNIQLKLPEEVIKTLQKGENVIAAHCRNRQGDAYLDFGLSIETVDSCSMQQTAVQKSVEVLPTQTIYTFTCGNVDLKLTFTAPLLMNDLDVLSRPVNYITYEVSSNDSRNHPVEIYLEASPHWALDRPSQENVKETFEKDGLLFLKTGSKSQDILGKSGDDVRIDWGYFYLVSDVTDTHSAIGDYAMRTNFCRNGNILPSSKEVQENTDALAVCRSLGTVDKPVQGFFMLGYDDIYSIQYFGKNLRPYWNRNEDKGILSIFETASKEYKSLKKSCDKFDKQLMQEATCSGGRQYAELCALAYRQTISAHKLVIAPNGDLLFLSKENFSNGGVATVDVSYPSAPLFLLYNVELAKGLLNPIFYYCESGKWNKPFAPHDLGEYPIVNGQHFDIDLPVEESANMLILAAAIATMEGNAEYANKHWNILTTWTDYLVEKGLNPEDQRCTDVFTGFSRHNTNLSVKAILGIASYGRLADMLGKNDISQRYTAMARSMAQEWIEMADDGDHYRLTFDQPGSWSQKYNLVWDKVMRMNIFPHEIAEKEVFFYLSQQQKYGLPLDSRQQYTKADWIVWSATLSPNVEAFQQFIAPLHRFVNETVDRVPMSDWYWTDKPVHAGFQARPVVGGFFIKLMEDELLRKMEL